MVMTIRCVCTLEHRIHAWISIKTQSKLVCSESWNKRKENDNHLLFIAYIPTQHWCSKMILRVFLEIWLHWQIIASSYLQICSSTYTKGFSFYLFEDSHKYIDYSCEIVAWNEQNENTKKGFRVHKIKDQSREKLFYSERWSNLVEVILNHRTFVLYW
jgi:hypothetical protein